MSIVIWLMGSSKVKMTIWGVWATERPPGISRPRLLQKQLGNWQLFGDSGRGQGSASPAIAAIMAQKWLKHKFIKCTVKLKTPRFLFISCLICLILFENPITSTDHTRLSSSRRAIATALDTHRPTSTYLSIHTVKAGRNLKPTFHTFRTG